MAVKVGDIIEPGVFGLKLRVMRVIGDKVITVHLDEWKFAKSDDYYQYASVNTLLISEIEGWNEK